MIVRRVLAVRIIPPTRQHRTLPAIIVIVLRGLVPAAQVATALRRGLLRQATTATAQIIPTAGAPTSRPSVALRLAEIAATHHNPLTRRRAAPLRARIPRPAAATRLHLVPTLRPRFLAPTRLPPAPTPLLATRRPPALTRRRAAATAAAEVAMPTTAAEVLAGEGVITGEEGIAAADPTAEVPEVEVPMAAGEGAALTAEAAVTRTANPRF